jgi:hypothetical protein
MNQIKVQLVGLARLYLSWRVEISGVIYKYIKYSTVPNVCMLMCGWHWNWKLMLSRISRDLLYRNSLT